MGLIVRAKHLLGMASVNISAFANSQSKTTYTFSEDLNHTNYFIMGGVEFGHESGYPTSSLGIETKLSTKFKVNRHVLDDPVSSGIAVIEEDETFPTTRIPFRLRIAPGGYVIINTDDPEGSINPVFSNISISGDTLTFDTFIDLSENLPENIYQVNAYGPGTNPDGISPTPVGGGNISLITRTANQFTIQFMNNDGSVADASEFGLQFIWFEAIN